ncbi:hypothetical protein G7046_g144 [Stylonectria norvegica]|nr:hypothetical protein G7046_g144 [Stylonectria norvegica]
MNGVHGIARWQGLFIISSTFANGEALIGFIVIPDSSAYTRAIWLTDAEEEIAGKRMDGFGANTSQLSSSHCQHRLFDVEILGFLRAWPSDHKVVLTFFFSTYATNADSPSLMAWMAELLHKEPEARAIVVASKVTIIHVKHATILPGASELVDYGDDAPTNIAGSLDEERQKESIAKVPGISHVFSALVLGSIMTTAGMTIVQEV